MSKKTELPAWDLTYFYRDENDPRISRDMKSIKKEYVALEKKYKGKVGNLTAKEVESFLDIQVTLLDKLGRVAAFASLLSSEDTNHPPYNILRQKVDEWITEVSAHIIFFSLEWRRLPEAQAKKIIASVKNPVHKHSLFHERKYAKHTLSDEIEAVLLEENIAGRKSWVRLFTQLSATIRYSFDKKEVNQAEILKLNTEKSRTTRKKAANAITKTLFSRKMEFTHIFNTLLAEKYYQDRRRKYATWVSSRNLGNKVEDKTVQVMTESIRDSYKIVADHYSFKKKQLGLETLYDYDRYAPLTFSKTKHVFSWKEARELVESAYTHFDPEFGAIITEFFEKKYIDARVLPNKRPGAFCSSTVASIHPYILMSFTERADDVMTLAHELGHGLHQYLAGQEWGQAGLGMPLVTQELASTFGELITFDLLLEKMNTPQEKLELITQKVDGLIATVFRQTAMYLFEQEVHTKRWSEGELTYEQICEAWITTQREMFGKSVTLRDDYQNWWSYIPHFIHTPGYVYAYAFGELIALSLYKQYLKNPSDFIPKYKALLKAGDSDYPSVLLKKLGIDITDPNIWKEGLSVIEGFIKKEKALAKQIA